MILKALIKYLRKKNHSMIFIPPNKVFILGGNDKKVFYFDTKIKQFFNLNDLNIIRTEPALQVIGNTLYCFDNVNKADNEKLSFEKIDINNPDAEWELIHPIMNTEKFPQKFFAVSKDNAGKNIIFLGGNMDDNVDSENLKNYKYNIESNSIEQTNIPFRDFNYKEKTFLTYNKNVDYLLPDFNRQHPIVTFYVKNREKFEKINYLPKTGINDNENYIQKSKYFDSKYDFNMPLIPSSNMEIPIKGNIKIGLGSNNNLQGINVPSFENIDLEKNKIIIDQEPTLKEPEIEPNKGDQQINLEIPNKFDGFIKGKKMIINKGEEEKNSEEYPNNNLKLKYNGNSHFSGNFNLMNNGSNNLELNPIIGLKNGQINPEGPIIPEDNIKGKIDGSLNLNPEIQIKKGSINLEEEKNDDMNIPNIHMPKQEGINLDDIKFNVQNEPNNLDIELEGVKPKLNELDNKLNGNITIGNNNEPNIDIKKDINANINVGTVNVKAPEIKINAEKDDLKANINLPDSQNYGFFLGGTIPGNKDTDSKKSKEFNMYGIISGNKTYDSNKIKMNLPNLGEQNLKIEGKLQNDLNLPNYKADVKGVNLKTDLKLPETSKKGAFINVETPDINIENPNINVEGADINKKINLEGNIPETDLNINAPGLKGNIEIPKIEGNIEGPNINAEIPKVDIEGKDLNLKNPGINLNLDGDLPNVDINKPNVDLKLGDKKDLKITGPNIDIKGEAPKLKKPELDFGLSGIIPGNDYIVDQNIKGSRRLYGSNMNVDIPEANLKGPKLHVNPGDGELKGSRRLDFNMNNDIKGGSYAVDLNAPQLKNNLEVKGNINGPKISDPKLNVGLKLPETKTPNIKIEKNGIFENITGIIQGTKPSSKIDVKIPDAKISGNIKMDKPEIKGPSGELDIKDPNLKIPNLEANAKLKGLDINSPNMDIKGSGIDMKGGKVDIRNADIKGPNINIDGKLPDMNIKGKEGFILCGVIKGKKDYKRPKIPDVNIGGTIKGNIPDLKAPNVELNMKNKELEIKQNIKDVNINAPELNLQSPNINLKGKTPNLSRYQK